MNIVLVKSRLTDGSNVYDVELHEFGSNLVLNALDANHAGALLYKLQAAINAHTNENIQVIERQERGL